MCAEPRPKSLNWDLFPWRCRTKQSWGIADALLGLWVEGLEAITSTKYLPPPRPTLIISWRKPLVPHILKADTKHHFLNFLMNCIPYMVLEWHVGDPHYTNTCTVWLLGTIINETYNDARNWIINYYIKSQPVTNRKIITKWNSICNQKQRTCEQRKTKKQQRTEKKTLRQWAKANAFLERKWLESKSVKI